VATCLTLQLLADAPSIAGASVERVVREAKTSAGISSGTVTRSAEPPDVALGWTAGAAMLHELELAIGLRWMTVGFGRVGTASSGPPECEYGAPGETRPSTKPLTSRST
jgi:hypothetical protein